MSVREDITIDWQADPRIIKVAAPSTEVLLQDLIDTLRNHEYVPTPGWNVHSYDYIVDAEGKAPTIPGEVTGITLKLRNAKLKFEDRVGPSYELCQIFGGNLTAIDSNGDDMHPIEPSEYVNFDRTLSTSATITGVDAADIASAVWDASALSHMDPGTMGLFMWVIRGLSMCEFRQNDIVYANGKMTSCNVRIFKNKSDADNDQNQILELGVTAQYDENGNRTLYLQTITP